MPKDKRQIIIYVFVSNFVLNFGFRIWQALFNNFAVEEMGVGPGIIGWIQALREIPGLLGFLVGFIALYISEFRIMALSVSILGVGIIFTGMADNLPFLLVSTVLMSIGFHSFYPSNNAVLLMSTNESKTPQRLGLLRSLGAIAALSATIAVYIFAESWGYQRLFTIVGGGIVVAGISLWFLGNYGEGLPEKRKVILRKQYWLYYLLAFLMGSRRHIFTTFAIFLLVSEYRINIQTTATLFFINSLINIFVLPLIGKLVNKIGERLVLTIAFTTIVFIFLGYAFITYVPILYALYVIDNIIFGFNLAITTYFQKIAVTQEEITSSLSVEQSINHIAALIVPVFGGIVWEIFGPEAPFLMGAGIVFVSLVITQFMRAPNKDIRDPRVSASDSI